MDEIINAILTLDENVFLALNSKHTGFFDAFMFLFSNKFVWIPFYISIIYILIYYWKKDAIWIIIAMILCVLLADQFASGVLKPLVKRLRPTHTESLQGLIHTVNGYMGGKYGFVSSHTANSFGLALLSSLLLKNKKYTFFAFLWAITNAYSRIYLGVHYPLDIIGGAIVGLLSALLLFKLLKYFCPQLFRLDIEKKYAQDKRISQKISSNFPVIVLLLTVFVISIYSCIRP